MSENKTLEQKKALEYHNTPNPGKFGIKITKPLKSRKDFGYAYTPGVAEPCLAIKDNKSDAFLYTNKGNTVAVISNGTAVLGLGDIGALSGKPVMEGKAVLMKYLAGIDGLDVEVEEKDPEKLSEIIRSIACTYGAINLEDVSAPACFIVDEKLTESLGIPFCHDDQHGTAIVVNAAVRNALEITQKDIKNVKIVFNGAGAAAMACANLLCSVGAKAENIFMFDSTGILHTGRTLDKYKSRYARPDATNISLKDALKNADVFIGLSVANALSEDDIQNMAPKPIVFAMANPVPEILPTTVKKIKPDAVVGSGRSDFVNQVNNVLCFPFLFRGALDTQAKAITMNMKLACAQAIMETAKDCANFDADHVIPDAFDPILLYKASAAVAKAAIADKVAQKEIPDNYDAFLDTFVYGYSFDAKALGLPKFESVTLASENLRRIFAHHKVANALAKTLHICELEQIWSVAAELKQAIFVFENSEIGYNANSAIKCDNLAQIKQYAEKNQLIGIVGSQDLWFNCENRIWYAHKLCYVAGFDI